MNNAKRKLIFPLIIGSMSILSGCGGGGGSSSSEADSTYTPASSSLSSYFFAGTTEESGTEIWKSDGTEAGTVMVKEINEYAGSNPTNFTQVGEKIFFLATTRSLGPELWVADATGTRLVKTINPTGYSSIQSLTPHGDELFFTANNGVNGIELWKSDGTEAGTIMVKDLSVGGSSFYPMQLTSSGDALYFTDRNKYNLWKTDGTEAGTVQVNTTKSFNYGGITQLTPVGTKLYFKGYNSILGTELWVSDGTDAGTVVVKDIQLGTASGLHYSYSYLYNVNGKLFFSAYSGLNGEGKTLWTSDGTEVGTTQVLDSLNAVVELYTYSNYAKVAGNHLYYRNSSYQNWKTDGTAEGTVATNISYSNIFGTINNKILYSSGSTLAVIDNVDNVTNLAVSSVFSCKTSTDYAICFSGTDEGQYNVWKTDGTLEGTVDITSVVDAGKGYVTDTDVLPVSSGIYYAGLDSTNSLEPWFSDGTAAGTMILSDLVTTPIESSDPSSAIEMNGIQYFLADDNIHGEGLWRTDGTEDGTYLVKDININSGDNIGNIVVFGNKLFFSARDNQSGQELWVSDGTEQGTQMFIDLASGNDSSYPSYLTVVGNKLYWEAWGYVWVTDGTLEGTNLASTVEPDDELVVSGENVYFTDDNDYGLWVTSGSFASTRQVKPSNSSYNNGYPQILTGSNGSMYYTSEDEEGNRQLWITDGTDEGTFALTNGANDVYIRYYEVIGNNLYFSMSDEINGTELWKSDGTIAGTIILKDINIGNDDSDPSHFYVFNDVLFFTAYSGVSEYDELWKTDGTATGTVKVTDVLADKYNYSNFFTHNNRIYFTVTNLEIPELWVSDGTVEGTKMLRQFDESTGEYSFNFSSYEEKLFFTVRTAIEGRELWVSDGTDTGTHIVKDINLGVKDGASSIRKIGDDDCC